MCSSIVKTLEYFLGGIDVREVEIVAVECTPRRGIGTALWRIVDIREDIQVSPRRWVIVGRQMIGVIEFPTPDVK